MARFPAAGPQDRLRPEEARFSVVRWRAVIAGVLLTVWINGFDPISRYLIHSSTFTNSQMPFALLLGLLVLGCVYNPLARVLKPRWVLLKQDLAAVLAVGFLGSTVPTLAARFIAVVSAPDYYATPENEWSTYTLPNLREWLFPSNAGGGVSAFYQGLPPGDSAPWGIWFEPLFWWFSLLAAIMLACLCLSVILRKQWSENERLSFPFVALSLSLVEEPASGRLLPGYFRERLFWIGFGIPAMMILWNTVGHFSPGFPTFAFLNTYSHISLGRGFPQFYITFDFYVICFAYFTTLEILLSMWLFHFLATVQVGLSHRIGFGPQSSSAGLNTQNTYSLVVFVLWGLWMARRHFLDVWRKAIGRAPEVDDSEELLSYRTAAFGFIFAGLYIFFWLCKLRMRPDVAFAFMFFSFVLYLGMAKIVALSGLVSLRGGGPTGPPKSLIGAWNMDDTSIATLNQMGALYGWAKGFAMPGAANGAKAAERASPRKRRLGGAIFIGGALSVFVFVFTVLLLGYYGPGAENFGDYNYTDGNRHFFNYTVSEIKGRTDAKREWWDAFFAVYGAAMTGLLILLNQRLPWWPLHPVGFTVSFQWPTRGSFFSIFVAWLFKLIILRTGGNQLYNRTKIFIVGVLVGYAMAVMISFVLDIVFFMGQGHAMHTPPI